MPWLANLPKTFDTLLPNWPVKYNQFLFDHVLTEIDFNKNDFEIRFGRIDQLYNSIHLQKITREEYLYGFNIVSTRNVLDQIPTNFPGWFDDTVQCAALVPIFDFLNHAPNPSCSWLLDDIGLLVKSDKSIFPGEELFIDYGYGF